MPWHFGRGNTIVCTAGCADGWMPCPVDHAAQPRNEVFEGIEFFRCEECDFVVPDEWGENDYESAGKLQCPECLVGERNDTFDGPCEQCRKKNRPASQRTFPPHLDAMIRAKKHTGLLFPHNCAQCWQKALTQQEQEYQRIQESKRHTTEHGHKPPGTCDSCGKIDYLDVVGPDDYICVRCSPTWPVKHPIPEQRQPEEPPGNPAGWYPDPEYDGHLRWWSGTEWAGTPTLPEHCTHNA